MSLLKRQEAYQKGVRAEALAADMLKDKGFEVLKLRYKTRFGEVDIVAKQDDLLVFAEVKARKCKEDALFSVNAKTRERIQQAALYFISEEPEYVEYGMRFDVITVVENDGAISVSHLDNAWMVDT